MQRKILLYFFTLLLLIALGPILGIFIDRGKDFGDSILAEFLYGFIHFHLNITEYYYAFIIEFMIPLGLLIFVGTRWLPPDKLEKPVKRPQT